MKNIYWKLAMSLSITTMVIGFVISLYGLHLHDEGFIYVGLIVIVITCISWWIWVMAVIKAMWDFTQRTVRRVSEIRDGVREVRSLFEEYKKLQKR